MAKFSSKVEKFEDLYRIMVPDKVVKENNLKEEDVRLIISKRYKSVDFDLLNTNMYLYEISREIINSEKYEASIDELDSFVLSWFRKKIIELFKRAFYLDPHDSVADTIIRIR